MKRGIVYLVISSFLLQVGCSSITQIPYPVDESKSENEIRSLNYFGERLTSTIHLNSSIEVEAYWLNLKDDKIYFLTVGLDDTTSISTDKIKSIYFFDWWRGFLFGGLDGLVLAGYFGIAGPNYVMPPIGFSLGMAYGLYALGDREFVFVQDSSE